MSYLNVDLAAVHFCVCGENVPAVERFNDRWVRKILAIYYGEECSATLRNGGICGLCQRYTACRQRR